MLQKKSDREGGGGSLGSHQSEFFWNFLIFLNLTRSLRDAASLKKSKHPRKIRSGWVVPGPFLIANRKTNKIYINRVEDWLKKNKDFSIF